MLFHTMLEKPGLATGALMTDLARLKAFCPPPGEALPTPLSWNQTDLALQTHEVHTQLVRHQEISGRPERNLLRHTPSFAPHTAHPDDVERANRASSAPSTRPVPSDDIRQWARRSGHEVPHRGRIPAAIRQAYDDARPWP